MFAAAPATAYAAKPYNDKDLTPTPLIDKSLVAHQRAHAARTRHAAHLAKVRAAARKRRAERAAQAAQSAPATTSAPAATPGYLAAIAACESGGNPGAIGGGGMYRGAFQMTYAAWQSVGGTGDPAAAPMSEQVRRAAMLYAQSGPGQWPVCGQ
jgi:hypothetical protein